MVRLELGLGLEVVGFRVYSVPPPGETLNGEGYKIQKVLCPC
jgi:hypothetical protein